MGDPRLDDDECCAEEVPDGYTLEEWEARVENEAEDRAVERMYEEED